MEVYSPETTIRSEAGRPYRLGPLLNEGRIAYSYSATDAAGKKVFLKAYCEPTRQNHPWLPKYRTCQQGIQERLRTISQYAPQLLDEFEYGDIYHQVIEWQKGVSLTKILEDLEVNYTPDRAMTIARVMLFALSEVHRVGIVHEDLKPDNVWLERDETIGLKYRVQVCDFDFAFLESEPTPWPSGRAAAGTFGYMSPEHLRKQRPSFASDMFTTGVILYEIFLGTHPFNRVAKNATTEEQANNGVLSAVAAGTVPSMQALDSVKSASIPPATRAVIESCLASDPTKRPTAKDVHAALRGVKSPARLVLTGAGGLKWRISERAELTRAMCTRMFNVPAATVSQSQAILEPADDYTSWFVTPSPGTTNATMINGAAIRVRTELSAGMRLQVGNPSSGKIGLELVVGYEPRA
jgi:serine/threonine protein kinase